MTPHNNHCFRVLNDTILFANSILTIYVSIFFFFFFFCSIFTAGQSYCWHNVLLCNHNLVCHMTFCKVTYDWLCEVFTNNEVWLIQNNMLTSASRQLNIVSGKPTYWFVAGWHLKIECRGGVSMTCMMFFSQVKFNNFCAIFYLQVTEWFETE